MPRGPASIAVLAAALAAAGPAAAFTIVPADDGSGRIVVVVERAHGDTVPFRLLEGPRDPAIRKGQGPDGLSLRWRYPSGRDEGSSRIRVAEDGSAAIRFSFLARQPRSGDRLAAAAVLAGAQGRALHTVHAIAAIAGTAEEDGSERRSVVLEFARPRQWWDEVEAIVCFFMSYPAERGLDDAAIRAAMRRAVGRFTRGEGSEQFEQAAGQAAARTGRRNSQPRITR